MHIQERRNACRYSFGSPGYAIISGRHFDLKTYNVSQQGALVEFVAPLSLKKGARLHLRLDIGFTGRAVVCHIEAYSNCTVYGLKFDRFDSHSDLVLSAYFVKYEQYLSAAPSVH